MNALLQEITKSPGSAASRELDELERLTTRQGDALQVAAVAAQLRMKRTATLHDAIVKAVNRALAANPELANDLSLTALEDAYLRFQDAVDAPRSSPEAIAAAKQAGHDLGSSTLAVAAKSAQAVDRLLAKRVDGLESRRNQLLGLTLLLLVLAFAAACSAGRRWIDSQLRTSVLPVAKKPAPELLWPMATVRARAFIPHRAAQRKTQ